MTDAKRRSGERQAAPAGPLDPAVLAAFLDGTLTLEERAKVMELLAEDDEARRILLDASAVMHGTEDSAKVHPAAVSTPPRLAFLPRMRHWITGSAAAVIVLGAAALLTSRRGGDPYLLPATNGGAVLQTTSWSVSRGEVPSGGADLNAYRVGATIVRLRHAWITLDRDGAATERNVLTELLGDVPGSAAALSGIPASGDPPNDESPADAAERLALDLRPRFSGSPHFDLGIWTEKLRLATPVADIEARGTRADGARRLADRYDQADTVNADAVARLLRKAADLLIDSNDGGALNVVVDSIATYGGG
jgi:hypothetical protein